MKTNSLASFFMIWACLGSASFAHASDADLANAKKINVSRPIFSQLVVHGIPKGWKSGYENATPTVYIQEFVPADETVDNWTEMITVRGFKDLAKNPDVSAVGLLQSVAAGIKKICGDKFVGQSLGAMQVDSYDAHAAIIGCANVPTAKSPEHKPDTGEIAYSIAIKGASDIYVIQRAVRTAAFDPKAPPITRKNISELMQDVLPIKICDKSASQFECWERSSR